MTFNRYLKTGQLQEALSIFTTLQANGCILSNSAFLHLFKACADSRNSIASREIYTIFKQFNVDHTANSASTAIYMFGKCNCLDMAELVSKLSTASSIFFEITRYLKSHK